MSDRKIITSFVYPPIPYRGCDWQAHYADEGEEAGRYGWGKSREAAIKDLKQRYDDDDQCPICGDDHEGQVPLVCETGDGV